MKRIRIFIVMCLACIGFANAAERGATVTVRTATPTTVNASGRTGTKTTVRTTSETSAPRKTSERTIRQDNTKTRRAVTSTRVVRDTGPTIVRRALKNSQTRVPISARAATTNATARTTSLRTSRTATPARATISNSLNIATQAFDANFDKCHDAYFTCMDQFCALQNDKYRRCVCSSKLDSIKSRESALSGAATQLEDFKAFNIDAILKTPAEVKAMLSASEGELTLGSVKDTSDSAKKLATISDVLSKTKTNALSTQGKLDIAGDIKAVWSTTDLISGASIANLTGEALYNAVHAQCSELVSDQCSTKSALDMVVSAYGMYIENDCATILSATDKQATEANAAIRETGREMNLARLENYNAHNATSINDCVAGVREKITADTACGENYVHCLDLTGLYLNKATGAPIYTPKFYELGNQLSLSGDILSNRTNSKFVSELRKKRKIAEPVLETCRDIADEVWDEYLRQAITEIYQGQHEKIRLVKDECMSVVNTCYDTSVQQLRDYSEIEDQMLLGDRLELSEERCENKLTTCSNLYGGGPTGMKLLIQEMREITNEKIAKDCLPTLEQYAQKLCSPKAMDTNYNYPYGCRVYRPGEIFKAQLETCVHTSYTPYTPTTEDDDHAEDLNYPNSNKIWPITASSQDFDSDALPQACWTNRSYTSCKEGYWLHNNRCLTCPGSNNEWICRGGQSQPVSPATSECEGFAGTLYQKMVIYALEYCVRPSEEENPIPTAILGNVNTVMDAIKIAMSKELAETCKKLDGTWLTVFDDAQLANKLEAFYTETGAHTDWGLCIKKE